MKITKTLGLIASLLLITPLILVGCKSTMSSDKSAAMVKKVTLSGAQEVPAVTTAASGNATFTIDPVTKALSGTVVATNIVGTASHIHSAPAGKNGSVIIPLVGGGTSWTVPANTVLTADQYASLMAGNLYVNVHSAANPSGEIRGQILP